MHLFSGTLAFQLLNCNEPAGREGVHEERILEGMGRARNLKMGPEGCLYVAVETGGSLLRLLPVDLTGR